MEAIGKAWGCFGPLKILLGFVGTYRIKEHTLFQPIQLGIMILARVMAVTAAKISIFILFCRGQAPTHLQL